MSHSMSALIPGASFAGRGAAAGGGALASRFVGLGWGDGSAAAACVSNVRMTLPSLTLSPTLILTSLTTPALGDGTSIVALSDSSVTSGSSGFTLSPGLTNTSITGTSL